MATFDNTTAPTADAGAVLPGAGDPTPPWPEAGSWQPPAPLPTQAAAADAGPELCEQRVVRAQSINPEVLIVLDKSASMAVGLRWDPSRMAVRALVSEFDATIAFGLSMFPAGNLGLCDPGRLDVPIQLGNAAAITQRIDSEVPFGITPTAQTLENVLQYMGNREPMLDGPPPPPAYVLLVTDGEPNCADLMHPDPIRASVNAVRALHDASVKTFVIGYGLAGIGRNVMQQLATAGGTDRYYAVENQADLTQAFREISKSIVSCSFELSEIPPDPNYVRVILDGRTIVLNDTDGWVIEGKVVTLQGMSCGTLRDGKPHQLESQVECEPVFVL